eukprot:2612202-Rhodomonas_salina.2
MYNSDMRQCLLPAWICKAVRRRPVLATPFTRARASLLASVLVETVTSQTIRARVEFPWRSSL